MRMAAVLEIVEELPNPDSAVPEHVVVAEPAAAH